MPHLKHTAILEGQILRDLTTGQRYMLEPSEQEQRQGIWQYDPQADGANWNYLLLNGVTYAVNGAWVDWDEDILEWDSPTMGQWPFGNVLSEEEQFLREADAALCSLDCFLEAELDFMDQQENELDDDDDDSDESSDDGDWVTDDEGYETSPEVDFFNMDYWALGLCSWLWKMDLYLDTKEGFWTL